MEKEREEKEKEKDKRKVLNILRWCLRHTESMRGGGLPSCRVEHVSDGAIHECDDFYESAQTSDRLLPHSSRGGGIVRMQETRKFRRSAQARRQPHQSA